MLHTIPLCIPAQRLAPRARVRHMVTTLSIDEPKWIKRVSRTKGTTTRFEICQCVCRGLWRRRTNDSVPTTSRLLSLIWMTACNPSNYNFGTSGAVPKHGTMLLQESLSLFTQFLIFVVKFDIFFYRIWNVLQLLAI